MENHSFISYFPLEEYVNNIKLSDVVLEHAEETSCEFDNYMRKLCQYDDKYIVNYWVYLLYNELRFNQKIENSKFKETDIAKEEVFFDTLNISHNRIHQLHNFIMKDKMAPSHKYRDTEVNVSTLTRDGKEIIYWRGVNSKDLNKFMCDYIKIYRQNRTSLLFSNPFLVSGLIHLLFVRIHPYTDGNGRTSRLIHNIKFTESVNKIYGSKLKISPLNLSESIAINKITYVNKLNNIYFDLEHDTNKEINDWFQFILNMADEQLYKSNFLLTRIPEDKLKEMIYQESREINPDRQLRKTLNSIKHNI